MNLPLFSAAAARPAAANGVVGGTLFGGSGGEVLMTTEAERLESFLQAYEQYVRDALQPTQIEIRDLLTPWQHPDHWTKYKRTNRIPIPTPIRSTFTRIKRPEQVVDKIFRKPQDFPDGLVPDSFRGMRDALGVRIVVYFLGHLPLIDRELRNTPGLEISEEQPPVAYLNAEQVQVLGLGHLEAVEKESGYCSIHYGLRLTNSSLPKAQRPWFELQVRTLSMELWSTMEHHLGYKPGKRTNMTARRQFRVLSKMIGAIDEHFNLLYEELNRFQEAVTYDGTDPISPENLPPVLAEVGVSCAQRDINNILKFLYSRGVETVQDVRALATPNRLDLIRNTYVSEKGRAPFNLEIIAALAAIKHAMVDDAEIRRAVKSQIAYRGAWDSIRQEFLQEEA